MRTWIGLAALIAAGLAAAPARACLGPEFERALVHNALPRPLPPGAIVAEVVLQGRDERDLYRSGMVANVRRMLQGPRATRRLILKQAMEGSCDRPFGNGRAGFIVGKLVGRSRGVIVIQPVFVPRSKGFRLPDGYRMPRDPGRDSR